jgi:hypothetical protein
MATSWRRAPVIGNGFAWLKQDGTALTTITDPTYDLGQPRFSIVVFSKNADKTAKFVCQLAEVLAHAEQLLCSGRQRKHGAQAQHSGRQARIAARLSIALSMFLQLGGDV